MGNHAGEPMNKKELTDTYSQANEGAESSSDDDCQQKSYNQLPFLMEDDDEAPSKPARRGKVPSPHVTQQTDQANRRHSHSANRISASSHTTRAIYFAVEKNDDTLASSCPTAFFNSTPASAEREQGQAALNMLLSQYHQKSTKTLNEVKDPHTHQPNIN